MFVVFLTLHNKSLSYNFLEFLGSMVLVGQRKSIKSNGNGGSSGGRIWFGEGNISVYGLGTIWGYINGLYAS